MPAREPILDPLLALKQPIHRRVQIVLIDAADPELLSHRGLAERADGPQLRRRRDHPLADHRQHQIPLPGRGPIKQPTQLQPPGHRQRRLHMPGRQRPLDRKRRPGRHQHLAPQR